MAACCGRRPGWRRSSCSQPHAPSRTVEGVVSRTFARTGLMVVTAPIGLQVPAGAWVRTEGGGDGIVIGQHMHLVFAALNSQSAQPVKGEAVRLEAGSRSVGSLMRLLRVE
ncbi:hypothetical protein T492DRAFT_883477, partial [Pavlovales sp. CCMP2436]